MMDWNTDYRTKLLGVGLLLLVATQLQILLLAHRKHEDESQLRRVARGDHTLAPAAAKQRRTTVVSQPLPPASDPSKVGEKGGAWTAQTHLKHYGYNVDWGLMEVLESSCREIENARAPAGAGWSRYNHTDKFHPLIGWWKPPPSKKHVNCRVLEVGCGVGVYVDALKEGQARRNRVVIGIEPNPMGGVFERGRAGPKQLAVDILAEDGGEELARRISRDKLDGEKFDLIYSIEVFEHMPKERHDDAVRFLASASRQGTKLIFGAAKQGQGGVGHIGRRRKKDWISIMARHNFRMDKEKTADAVHQMQEFNHRQNTVVYYYHELSRDKPLTEM